MNDKKRKLDDIDHQKLYKYNMKDIKINSNNVWKVFKASQYNVYEPSPDNSNEPDNKNRKIAPQKKINDMTSQDHAIQFSKDNQNIPVFAKQNKVGIQGYHFIVSTYEYFWTLYSRMGILDRVFNEVLGINVPVHFHIDCDCNRACNPHIIAGSEAEKGLFVEIESFIHTCFSSILNEESMDDIRIIVLDASNEKKLSRHYVVKMKNKMFKDNKEVGMLVKYFLSKIPSDSKFHLKKEGDKPAIFVDHVIYSANRAFRMKYSTKSGVERPLLSVDMNETKYSKMDKHSFMDSLVAAHYPEEYQDQVEYIEVLPILEAKGHDKATLLKFAPKSSQTGHKTILPSSNDKNRNTTSINTDGVLDMIAIKNEINNIKNIGEITELFNNRKKMEEIILIMMAKLTNCNLYGSHFNEEGSYIRTQAYSKTCEIKGGDHSSNHIGFIFYLDKMYFCQTCPSPSCTGKFGKKQHITGDNASVFETYHNEIRNIPLDVYFSSDIAE